MAAALSIAYIAWSVIEKGTAAAVREADVTGRSFIRFASTEQAQRAYVLTSAGFRAGNSLAGFRRYAHAWHLQQGDPLRVTRASASVLLARGHRSLLLRYVVDGTAGRVRVELILVKEEASWRVYACNLSPI